MMVTIPRRTDAPTSKASQEQTEKELLASIFTPNATVAPGEVLVRSAATNERDELRKLGLNDDDAVPRNLADLIAAIREDSKQPPAHMQAIPKLQMPKTTSIESLSPEQQAKLKQDIQRAVAEDREIAQAGGVPPEWRPKQESTKTPQLTAPLLKSSRTVNLDEALREDEKEEALPADSAEGAPQDGLKIKNCPACGFPCDKEPAWVKPPIEKVREYVLASCANQPYRETYKAMGGKLEFTFRTLTMQENNIITQQLDLDDADKTNDVLRYVENQAARTDRWSRYRMALQLSRVSVDGKETHLAESLDDYEVDPADLEGRTKVSVVADYVLTDVLSNEMVYRTALHYIGQFNQMVTAIWYETLRPDFTVGT